MRNKIAGVGYVEKEMAVYLFFGLIACQTSRVIFFVSLHIKLRGLFKAKKSL